MTVQAASSVVRLEEDSPFIRLEEDSPFMRLEEDSPFIRLEEDSPFIRSVASEMLRTPPKRAVEVKVVNVDAHGGLLAGFCAIRFHE